jgi:N-acetylmuramoyl-L-alanine amidase
MRHHRARCLHILAIAPVAAIAAGVLGPTSHVLAAASRAPVPIVVMVDPGHGGQPTPAHPTMPFDPGVIGTNGLVEKDFDLDVGMRLAALLRADLVDVVMTRSTDVYVSAARRAKISTAHRAVLVVSIHANSAANPRTNGSRVLYPTNASAALAQTVSDALIAQVMSYGVSDGGVSLGDAAWVRSGVPTATIEMGYLTNRRDATLMATASFRQDMAVGVRNGIEAYVPAIIARRGAIRAWRSSHPGSIIPGLLAPASATLPGSKGFQFGPVIAWLAGISAVGLVLLFRDAVARVLVVLGAVVVRLFGGVLWLRRAAIRRQRRRQRTRTSAHLDPEPEQRVVGPRSSVYDDIPL